MVSPLFPQTAFGQCNCPTLAAAPDGDRPLALTTEGESFTPQVLSLKDRKSENGLRLDEIFFPRLYCCQTGCGCLIFPSGHRSHTGTMVAIPYFFCLTRPLRDWYVLLLPFSPVPLRLFGSGLVFLTDNGRLSFSACLFPLYPVAPLQELLVFSPMSFFSTSL